MTRRRTLARAVFRIALRTLKWGTLAAALLVAGVWVGGQRTACFAAQRVGKGEVWVYGHTGGVRILYTPWGALTGPDFWNFYGYFYTKERVWLPSFERSVMREKTVRIPYWLPILLFASISYGLFRHDRRAARRAKVGMCPSCGYSRAGLALDAVCPECGKAKA